MRRRRRLKWRVNLNPIGLVNRNGRELKSRRQRFFNKRKFWRSLGWAVIVFLFLGVLIFTVYSKDLPNPNKIKDRQITESTKIYDREGKLLYEFHGEEKRTIVTSDQISPHIKQATVAIEDKNFYQHPGVDLGGVAKAVARKLLGRRAKVAGGSTITQQYIKNVLLTSERSLSRKIKELILSLEVEQIYSKEEILTGYLNQIPYGNNAYGVEAASRSFFDKSAKDLTLSEAALLAALPQAPSYYLAHTDDLIGRKDHILDRMVEEKMITKKEAMEAKKTPPSNGNITFSTTLSHIKAPHFVFYVREELIKMLGGGPDAELKLMTTGFKVKTTLDSRMQKAAEKAIEKNKNKLQTFGASNAALAAIDPKTGQILAMVGSVDYFDKDFGSVNVANSPRQPGSSFKPIVYVTGFKGKYNPAFMLWDVPTRLDENKDKTWPTNYDGSFNGPLTVRQALQWSLNVPAVKMLHLAGQKNAIQTAQDLGITTLASGRDYGLSLVLGSGEVKLIEMAGAYATFANGGKRNPITPILKIEDSSGKVIKEYKDEVKQVLDPQIAYQITHILSDDATRSSRWGKTALRLNNRHNVAAKTGTTSSFKDAWTIGYTTQLAAGVWVGNNNGKPMRSGADGLFIAAPIWNSFMQEALDGGNWPDEGFPRPAGIKEIKVDKWSNRLPSDQTPLDAVITDVFTSWQVPEKTDDVHIKVRLDKKSGKLATDLTPTDFIEEKYFTVVHSELPDKQTWESPVRAWAEKNGLVELPPTDYDDYHITANIPKVEITAPKNNETVSGNITLNSSVSGDYTITKMEFFIDGKLVYTDVDNPFSANFDVSSLSNGIHELIAKATNDLGLVGENKISFKVNADSVPPGDVFGVIITAGVKNITLQWKNPPDPDLDIIALYISSTSGQIGSRYNQNIAAVPNSNGSTKIDNLTTGATYYFTLHGVDKNGNENQTFNQYSGIPL